MGISGKREVTVVISGKFDANLLVNEINDLCDGRPEEYDGFLLGILPAADQRDSDTATLKFTRKEGIISRPRMTPQAPQMNVYGSPGQDPQDFDSDPFGENPSGIPG